MHDVIWPFFNRLSTLMESFISLPAGSGVPDPKLSLNDFEAYCLKEENAVAEKHAFHNHTRCYGIWAELGFLNEHAEQ